MGRPLLLLRLEGPLQSWGLRSRWDVRDTAGEPTKSGVIGLVGAALGYGRGDPRLEQLDAALRLGVRIERPGRRLVDFQTVTGILPTAEGGTKGTAAEPSTIVSLREYLQDAAFLVVLDGPPETLRVCAQALQNPRWPLFLGRKGCPPIRPVFEDLTASYDDVVSALQRHPWDWEGRSELQQTETPAMLQCSLEDPTGQSLRADAIRVNRSRMYAMRNVRTFAVSRPQ